MTNNPIAMMIQNMMRQGGSNAQIVAQNILRSNPQFASMLQGQDLRKMAIEQMKSRGIDPQTIMGNMNGLGNM